MSSRSAIGQTRMSIRLEENLQEIREVQEQIKKTESKYRKRDLWKRLRKLRKERSEALYYLSQTKKPND